MRVISARIKGFGRLADAKVNLDNKVIAVVGPNEAGKTTLLRALANLDSADGVPVPQRSRAIDVTDDTSVTAVRLLLDEADHKVLADLSLNDLPHSMTVRRRASGGTIEIDVRPRPKKNRVSLKDALAVFQTHLDDPDIPEYVNPETTYADHHGDAPRHYVNELRHLVDGVQLIIDRDDDQSIDDSMISDCKSLHSVTLDDEEDGQELRKALSAVIDWLELEPPITEVTSRLWNRSPDFLFFDEPDRNLQSAYTLNETLATSPPAALDNMARMAGLDLAELYGYQQTGDVGRRLTLLAKVNKSLDSVFAGAWKQSLLSVHFDLDGTELRIVIWEGNNNVTVFSERSAGLRMFVALTAFLNVHDSGRPPILLIDEAETHLHVDAQADLVSMFITQQQVAKIIYTTHSPACLPPDLGSGVRCVVPRADNQQISDIRNSFWQGVAGYSPLMMAMGAAAAAFTPARCVVLAEGATEMILMPSLIRAAVGLQTLNYQVAPGLSEVPQDLYPKLDFEGAKVAYLIDGDDGGLSLKRRLVSAGVPEHLIIQLDVPGIENLLDGVDYVSGVRALLAENNLGLEIPALPDLPPPDATSWAKHFADWAKQEGMKMPSKVAVCSWLIENNKATPSNDAVYRLANLHKELEACFS